ncbi:hypothetical protein [Winogradskyella sp. PE311]|uniref:hypothetical protein n=1 Tax=Winogradskyella sp. PE311 TaxID=3366943 RepID=UPI0039814BB8
MMKKQYIELRKQSDFSGILTDTFGFIRNEFKPFMKTIFSIAGPALLIYMLSFGVYNYVAGDIFNFTAYGETTFNSGSIFMTLIAVVFYVISAIVTYVLMASSALFYIKFYIQEKGTPNLEDVKRSVYKSFWPFLGLGFLKGLTLGVALMLCLLPILYMMVPMAVAYSIYVFETRRSATDAYSQSFSLVNADFWTAWGSFIVLFILYYVLALVFSVPSTIYAMLGTGILSGEIDPANLDSFGQDPVIIVLSVIQSFFQTVFNIILVVGGAVIYFHLYEKTNFTGTYERISEIGKIEE